MAFAHDPKTTASADLFPPAKVRDAFSNNLRKTVGCLAEPTRTAIAYLSPEGRQWVLSSAACPCSQSTGQDVPCLKGPQAKGRECQAGTLWYKNRSAGTLAVCCDASILAVVEPTVRQVAVLTLRQLELEQENESLRAEHTAGQASLETAAHIQRTLLLGRPTINLKSQLSADAVSIPALQVGGDFYDFFTYDQVLDVVIGDVMGKGIQAALLGAATKNHLLRAVNYLLASNPARLPEPREILSIVNAEVYRQLAGIDSFVTLCFARFDLRQQRVQIIDCGHTKTVHAREDVGTSTLLQGENMPLGFSRADVYKEVTVPLDSGDVFFFYSDGVTEARKAGEDFGEARLAELVRSLRQLDPRDLVEKVGAAVLAFSGSRPPKDDLTCVAVKVQDLNRSRGSQRTRLEIASDLREVPRAEALLREFCRDSVEPTSVADDLGRLQEAVRAVLEHIVRHSYCGQTDKTIRIEASLFVRRFSVRIYHRGEPFDLERPSAAPGKPAAEDTAVYTACRHVDAAQCSRSAHGEHCVFLEKWLNN